MCRIFRKFSEKYKVIWLNCVECARFVNFNGKVLNKHGHELINGGMLINIQMVEQLSSIINVYCCNTRENTVLIDNNLISQMGWQSKKMFKWLIVVKT